MKNLFLLGLVYCLLVACERHREIVIDKNYLEDWNAWNEGREDWIRDRYLRIFMMEELQEGINTVGNGRSNDVIVLRDAFPSDFGILHLLTDSVVFRGYYETFTRDSTIKPGQAHTLFRNEVTDTLYFADYSFFIFEEQDQYYVRFRDIHNPAALDHVPPATFPVNKEMIFWAEYIKTPHKMVTPLSGRGEKEEEYSGYLSFEYKGQTYQLNVKGGQLEFGDMTNGESTYAGGRYLFVDLDSWGKVLLDFNKSYSPPCAYSPFTICPLPPPENRLPFKVEAGQKYK